jgi:hypothetical protein
MAPRPAQRITQTLTVRNKLLIGLNTAFSHDEFSNEQVLGKRRQKRFPSTEFRNGALVSMFWEPKMNA